MLNWIEEQVYISNFIPPEEMDIHSANPVRAQEMRETIETIRRRVATRKERQENPVQFVSLVDPE